MLSIAMIGGTYSPDVLNRIIKKYRYGVDVPACVLQWKMIDGLSQDPQAKLYLINERRIPTFPTANIVFAKRENWDCKKAETAMQFSFINLPLIKKISKVRGITRELKDWYKKDLQDDKVVLIYALHTPYLLASTLFIRKKKIKQFLIIPDLPQYMNSSSGSILKRILKQIDAKLQKRLLKYVDGFFLLTKYIADVYHIEENKYIILEGIADTEIKDQVEIVSKNKAILYTGALSERYGIIKLIEAYEKCEDVGELWICGEGDARDKIEEACYKNKNIKYFGQIPRKEVLNKQRNASLLVNPRNSSDEYTKYSFPSKTMEYLQSGTPVLMSCLKGIPEQYEPYIYWVNNENVDGWANAIQRIMSLSDIERNNFGKRAQRFVSEEKNPIVQAMRMIVFMNNIREY
jgi:glycosyltransferase involved in cell wall biosynthesis